MRFFFLFSADQPPGVDGRMKRGYEHFLKDLETINWQRHPQNSLERAEEVIEKVERLRVRWKLRKHHL